MPQCRLITGIAVMFKTVPAWVQLVILSALLVPLAAFVVGSWVVGPYEGNFGILGFFFAIFRDALTLSPAAWIFLLAPGALLLTWRIALRARSKVIAADDE